MNPIEFYASYNRSVHVFVMCLAALLGPFFVASGLQPEYTRNLIFGVLLMGFYFYHVLKILPYRYKLKKSDSVAFLWVPVGCLPLGLVLAIIGYGI